MNVPTSGVGPAAQGPRRVLRRGPWEAGAMALIGIGVFMLMQPFSLWLYTYSFVTILAGTLAFVVVSHFSD